jgi:hypothetical protein
VTAKIVMTIEDEASILREFKRGAPIQSTASLTILDGAAKMKADRQSSR